MVLTPALGAADDLRVAVDELLVVAGAEVGVVVLAAFVASGEGGAGLLGYPIFYQVNDYNLKQAVENPHTYLVMLMFDFQTRETWQKM